MELTSYVENLQAQLADAADAGGPDARALAERLTRPLDSAARLVLMEVLSAAASEITRELAPGSVDVRLRGRDVEFVVITPRAATAADDDSGPDSRSPTDTFGAPTVTAQPVGELDDGPSARTTLRLPDQLKQRIDDAAAKDRLSVNAWMVRVLARAVELNEPARRQHGGRLTGWVR